MSVIYYSDAIEFVYCIFHKIANFFGIDKNRVYGYNTDILGFLRKVGYFVE